MEKTNPIANVVGQINLKQFARTNNRWILSWDVSSHRPDFSTRCVRLFHKRVSAAVPTLILSRCGSTPRREEKLIDVERTIPFLPFFLPVSSSRLINFSSSVARIFSFPSLIFNPRESGECEQRDNVWKTMIHSEPETQTNGET